MNAEELLQKLKGGLIVSCQALEEEPLHGSEVMGKMALAAKMGGAVGIRANTVQDIIEIKKNVDLPIIGIIKQEYDNSPVYITPTMKEVDALMAVGVEIVAVDATIRTRPDSLDIHTFIQKIKTKYSTCVIMADVSTIEEARLAQQCGVDIVATTLSGYTDYTKSKDGPDFELVEVILKELELPLIVEGKINTPEEAAKCIEMGAWAVVVGGAITRPQQITKRFADKIYKKS